MVCVATIKSEKLKRLSLRPPSSVICSALRERPAGAWMEGEVAEDEKNVEFVGDIKCKLSCGYEAAVWSSSSLVAHTD